MTYPRRGLISSLIVVGVLVIGGAVGLYFLISDRGNGPGSAPVDDPRAVSERFAEVMTRELNSDDADLAAFEQIVCGRDLEQVRQETAERRSLLRGGRPPGWKAEATVSEVQVTGERGMFTLTVSFGEGHEPVGRPYALVREGGAWRVCELYEHEPVPASASR